MKSCIDFYDDTAQKWADEWYDNNQMLPYFKKFLKYVNKKKPKILDLCCGAGYESMRLKKLGATVVGADLSEKSIQIAKEKNDDIHFYVKDILESYADLGKFNGIVCIAGIVHIKREDLTLAFKNMHEVLEHNGYLLLVFKEGQQNKKTVIFNGEVYARNFINHTKEELNEYTLKVTLYL